MEENYETEVVESNEVTDVAETKNDDGGIKLDAKTIVATAAVAGVVIGAASRVGEKAVDGVCQLGYNSFRWAQDKFADAKEAREEKKAERERRYQEKKAEKEAKREEKNK